MIAKSKLNRAERRGLAFEWWFPRPRAPPGATDARGFGYQEPLVTKTWGGK